MNETSVPPPLPACMAGGDTKLQHASAWSLTLNRNPVRLPGRSAIRPFWRLRTDSDQPINIVGAGLAGALLGVTLMRHGCGAIRLWDRRPDPRRTRMERGRSINLALAARGIRALEHAGVMEKVRPLLIPMRGRMIH